MQKKSTLKPFAPGDIFLGSPYLNNPDDDHQGEGRILQFDRNWIMKGTWYTTGTRYFIVGCKVAPDGTLWGFDCHDHITVRATPDGTELPPWDSGCSFGSVNWDRKGNHYFGEYFIGKDIWKGTSAKMLANGTLGDGRIHQYGPDLKPVRTFRADNAPEPTMFKGVTHSTLHPSGEFITYTTETARRLMRYDIRFDRQLPDLAAYADADPMDRKDRRWFIAPAYLSDGRLLCTDATGLAVYDEEGHMRQHIDLPGYGWAQVAPDVDERYALAANVWTGVAARIDLKEEKLVQQLDTGFTAPFRSLAGLAVFRG
mgnify:FL=1